MPGFELNVSTTAWLLLASPPFVVSAGQDSAEEAQCRGPGRRGGWCGGRRGYPRARVRVPALLAEAARAEGEEPEARGAYFEGHEL